MISFDKRELTLKNAAAQKQDSKTQNWSQTLPQISQDHYPLFSPWSKRKGALQNCTM